MQQTVRIAVVGPESSGKSTLCQALAERLGGHYVAEYARDYIYGKNLEYDYADVCHIADQNMREWQEADGLTIYDTEFIITRVWMDVEYGQHPEWMDQAPTADYYLVCRPDIAAVDEPIRTNNTPEKRQHYYEVYLNDVKRTGRPYGIVSGEGDARTTCALSQVETFLKTQNI